MTYFSRVFFVKCMLKCDRVNEDITILLYYIMLNVYWYTKSITPNSARNMQPAHSCTWPVCLIYMFTHPQVYTILATQCIHHHNMTYNTHSSEPWECGTFTVYIFIYLYSLYQIDPHNIYYCPAAYLYRDKYILHNIL